MRVYRLENNLHRGPYTSDNKYKWHLNGAHGLDDDHPSPLQERLERSDADLCGFIAKWKAMLWFRGWLGKLASEGFCMATYEVPAKYVKKGKRQVLFDERHAKLILKKRYKWADR